VWDAEEQKWHTRRLQLKARKTQLKPQRVMEQLKVQEPATTDLAKSLSSDFSSNQGSFPQSKDSSSVLKGGVICFC